MAGEPGTTAHDLIAALEAEPYAFDFFAAVRRLQCAHPSNPPIGDSYKPSDDPVRFCQKPSLAFASSSLAGCSPQTADSPAKLFVTFMGLLGPNGPMPLHVTEYALGREMSHDPTLAAFMDMFHHRMVSLLFRAWAAGRPEVNFERGDEDRFAAYVASFFGSGMDTLVGRDSVPDVAKLHFAGRLGCQAKNPEGLRAILADYFGVEAFIEEFVGQWVELPADCGCRLGHSPDTGMIGQTAIVGSRVWECQLKFRVVLGPMRLADYQRMLPGGSSLPRLVDWVRTYAGDELAWDVQLILRKDEVPRTRLGHAGRLGWSTWLCTRPPETDADELILRPFAATAAM